MLQQRNHSSVNLKFENFLWETKMFNPPCYSFYLQIIINLEKNFELNLFLATFLTNYYQIINFVWENYHHFFEIIYQLIFMFLSETNHFFNHTIFSQHQRCIRGLSLLVAATFIVVVVAVTIVKVLIYFFTIIITKIIAMISFKFNEYQIFYLSF